VHASRANHLELEITPKPPLDFGPMLGQNLERARSDSSQPDHP